ncbi:MAG: hypothetical protein H6Q90_814 [Deltaproteobacteria bacterium]|nr:hypothetical protein [Deltaproteobacteria bacterium]
MANEHTQDRGKLFENAKKLKPSQPDFQGDCTIDGTAYEILGWRREDQLTVSLAPPRGDRNTYPPAVFRGAFEAAPPQKPARPNARGAKDVVATPPAPAWVGDIESDDAAYQVRAFEKQGKSGPYFTLSFERVEKRAKDESPALPDPSELDD